MQFAEGAPVYTAEGEKVGDIERFVLDPRAREIIGLVVRKGFLFTEDRVVPARDVQLAELDRVVLRPQAGDPDDYPDFEEEHYVAPGDTELREAFLRDFYSPVYYYPPLGATTWQGTVYPPPQTTVKERNVPEGTVPMQEGANVISSDGEKVGDVERVFTDEKSREITHISITQGLLFKAEKVLPVSWVDTVQEDEVHLAVTADTLKNLETS